jgi:hypothetical protein
MESGAKQEKVFLFSSSEQYFSEMLGLAFDERKVKAAPVVKSYLVDLLQHYLDVRNLFDEGTVDELGRRKPQTLAELYLIAHQSEGSLKIEMLKKLADRSLYISGFFSDSLDNKIVDVDYYVDMGRSAYGSLSACVNENSKTGVFRTFSHRFVDFVDVLGHLSHKARPQSNENILKLYDRFLRTGSPMDREKLAGIGIPTSSLGPKRKIHID